MKSIVTNIRELLNSYKNDKEGTDVPSPFLLEYPERFSTYVSFAEGIKSQTATTNGIDNMPKTQEVIDNMIAVATHVFDPIRQFVGSPLYVSSFYRSPELNTFVGGSTDSQHCKGEAIDIDADVFGGTTNQKIFEFIRDNLDFDQIIHEFGHEQNPAWIHVSFKRNGVNRKSILRAYKHKGKTRYKQWI